MSVELFLAYLAACFVITIIPGPTVTLIVANSLAHGTRAGLLNVVGTQLGLGLMMLVLIVGLSSIIATMGVWFDWLRFAGATDYVSQVVLLGLTAMATAAISDGAYAVLAGGARTMLSRRRVQLVSRFGGLCLIGGGAWLALTRVR
jgi:threonine/homoserine/homoserine lactone efflux protein